jgi:hypothetical protein
MVEADFQEFSKTLTGTSEIYRSPLSPAGISLWWRALAAYDFSQVDRAFIAHSCDTERGQYMPKPADIVRAIEGSQDDKAMIAWSEVMSELKRVGSSGRPVFADILTLECVRFVGGWGDLCRSESSQMSFIQKRFTDAYKTFSRRQAQAMPQIERQVQGLIVNLTRGLKA